VKHLNREVSDPEQQTKKTPSISGRRFIILNEFTPASPVGTYTHTSDIDHNLVVRITIWVEK